MVNPLPMNNVARLRVLASAFACHPSAGSGLGGGEDVLGWNLVNQIARFHDVCVLTYAKNRVDIERALHENPIHDIHFYYVDLPGLLRPLLRVQGGHQFYYFLWQIRAYFTARRRHKQVRFDLFHHITYANDWMVSFIGALLPLPYVRGPGGGAHRTPTGFGKEYSFTGRLWEHLRAVGQWVFRHDPLFIMGQRRARSILVCNPEAMSAIPGKWGNKIELFPVNGITTHDLKIAGQGPVENQPFAILTAGTLIRVKGFGLAIKAFERFVARHPDSRFTVIGSGPEEPRLRDLVRRANLNGSVRFLKSMPRDRLLAEMASCDVFLFPSLRDGGGAVVIEAMGAGKPVVCLDTGGPGMHVTEEEGIKVSPGSPEQAIQDLANALELLHSDEELRLRLGKAGRIKAERVYHWDRLGDRLKQIYERALNR